MSTLKSYYVKLDSNEVKGGLYQVDNYTDIFRYNAATHFKDGMLCYVTKHDKYYLYYAKKNRWYSVNIKRNDIIDSSILIGGEWYSISKKNDYDALVHLLVNLKYSDEALANLDENMRAFPSLYLPIEALFLEWFTLVKEAAWNFLYADTSVGPYDLANREGDPSTRFDYPVLKETLDYLCDRVEFLYLAANPLSTKVTVKDGVTDAAESADGDILYINYGALNDSSVYDAVIDIHSYRGSGEVNLIKAHVTLLWDDSVIYDASVGRLIYNADDSSDSSDDDIYCTELDMNNILLHIDNPSIGQYTVAIESLDNKNATLEGFTKTILLTLPYFYGSSPRSDMAVRSKYERSDENTLTDINSVLSKYSKYISSNIELVLLNLRLYDIGFNYSILTEAIKEFSQNFYQITVTKKEYNTMGNLLGLYSMLLKKANEYLDLKDANAKKDYNMHDFEMTFFNLEGTVGGIKYLQPLEKVTINNMRDGNYIWICVPEFIYSNNIKAVCNDLPFLFSDRVFDVSTKYGNYKCLRSYGPKGIESGIVELDITY